MARLPYPQFNAMPIPRQCRLESRHHLSSRASSLTYAALPALLGPRINGQAMVLEQPQLVFSRHSLLDRIPRDLLDLSHLMTCTSSHETSPSCFCSHLVQSHDDETNPDTIPLYIFPNRDYGRLKTNTHNGGISIHSLIYLHSNMPTYINTGMAFICS